MRKLIVVLMAVLMLVSFTSCNQDKIDELEKEVKQKDAEIAQNKAEKETFTEFIDAFQSVMAVEEAYRDIVVNSKSSPITLYYKDGADNVVPKFSGNDSNIWIYQQALLKNPDIIDMQYDQQNTSGTVTYEGTPAKGNLTYSIVNNKIAVKYKLEDSEDWVTEPIKLDINGSLSFKASGDSDNATVTVAFNGTICGEDIDLSFGATYTETEFVKFTAAKINGNDVDLVLLNNVAAGMIPTKTLSTLFKYA